LVDQEEDLTEIYKPEIKKLSGLTVIGKIDLPAEKEKKFLLINLLKLMEVMISGERKKGKRY